MSDQTEDVANCWRICRNFQDYGAATVWKKLREFFHDKDEHEIAKLIIEVEKIVSQQSVPRGCEK